VCFLFLPGVAVCIVECPSLFDIRQRLKWLAQNSTLPDVNQFVNQINYHVCQSGTVMTAVLAVARTFVKELLWPRKSLEAQDRIDVDLVLEKDEVPQCDRVMVPLKCFSYPPYTCVICPDDAASVEFRPAPFDSNSRINIRLNQGHQNVFERFGKRTGISPCRLHLYLDASRGDKREWDFEEVCGYRKRICSQFNNQRREHLARVVGCISRKTK